MWTSSSTQSNGFLDPRQVWVTLFLEDAFSSHLLSFFSRGTCSLPINPSSGFVQNWPSFDSRKFYPILSSLTRPVISFEKYPKKMDWYFYFVFSHIFIPPITRKCYNDLAYPGRIFRNGYTENFRFALRRCDWLELPLGEYAAASNEIFCLFCYHYSSRIAWEKVTHERNQDAFKKPSLLRLNINLEQQRTQILK